jgi:hypothetical protein
MTEKRFKPHFHHLKKKWAKKHKILTEQLWGKHKDSLEWLHNSTKNAVVGSMAGILMLAQPANSNILAQNFLPSDSKKPKEEKPAKSKTQLITELTPILPSAVQELTPEQEQQISSVLTDYFNMNVKSILENKRLNRSYGYIGAEQHLMRYPGDTMDSHFDTQEEVEQFYKSGMAPGRGAWGYFAPSAQEMTEQDKQREKYYIAVQTFLSPGWNENVNEYYNFFKYRKMLVVNPENGKAMVVVIGDAGPAAFTGKHLGGSPEVMQFLERVDGGAKGPVLYFFIDDPENKIPLGPINMQ